ncbi:hypothetical protein [Mycobacterium sp. 1245852.3]|uniref:hypothetical protein n=1 Tax=Mycobacterium sp. 1245852.3 TaxID=1856860 RepID=UPI0012EA319F|nr:hypothetical protein [Mycobacterium sp. 1245852.3]
MNVLRQFVCWLTRRRVGSGYGSQEVMIKAYLVFASCGVGSIVGRWPLRVQHALRTSKDAACKRRSRDQRSMQPTTSTGAAMSVFSDELMAADREKRDGDY